MRLAKSLFVASLTVTLTAYAFDCGDMATTDQAMECCNSMPCSSHGHDGQDCCKTMPDMHPAFILASPAHGVFFSPIIVALVPELKGVEVNNSFARILVAHSHAPPASFSTASSPLRI